MKMAKDIGQKTTQIYLEKNNVNSQRDIRAIRILKNLDNRV